MGSTLVGADAPHLQHKTFQASAGSIHYVAGPVSGPPLVLLHGVTRDWKCFTLLLRHLSPRFHVIALDLRGHGASGRKPGMYRISDFAEDLTEFLQSSHVPSPAIVFGHSLGGMVALYSASRKNSSVRAAIVGDSVVTPGNLKQSMYYSLFLQLHASLRRGLSVEELSLAIADISIFLPGLDESMRLGDLPSNTRAAVQEWARSAALTDPEVLEMTLNGRAFEGWAPEAILQQIACPVLLLQGNSELDAVLTDSDVNLAKRLLPNAQHTRFPLLGHALFMQQPKPVMEEILRFADTLT